MSAAGATGALQGAAVVAAARGGGEVGGAALGRAAALDEAPCAVGILFRLQSGRREDIGGQPPQLIGPWVGSVFLQLYREPIRGGEGAGVKDRVPGFQCQ